MGVPGDMDVVQATGDDADVVAQVIRASFREEANRLGVNPRDHPGYVAFDTADRVRERIGRGETIAIASVGGEPVGTVSMRADEENSTVGHVSRLCVLPSYRGSGYGARLMEYAEAWLREREVTRIHLSLVAHFDRLGAFYERLGYVATETAVVHNLPFRILRMEKVIELRGAR